MESINFSSILTIAGGLSVVLGALYSFLKVLRELHRANKANNDAVLEQAKEYDKELKAKLEAKINMVEADLKNLEESVKKDLSNLKDSHAIELKNLGEKIELLRGELRDQSSGILTLLTKLVDKN